MKQSKLAVLKTLGGEILGNLLAKIRKFLNLKGTAKVCRIYI